MKDVKPKLKRVLINKLKGVKPLTVQDMIEDGYTEECIEEVTNNRGELPDDLHEQ